MELHFHHQSHPQLGVVFALTLSLHSFWNYFSISPPISNSILGTYQPGEFIFQCLIFLSFHTVHGVLKAIILKWFTILFSSEPCFVRTLHHDLSWVALHGSGYFFIPVATYKIIGTYLIWIVYQIVFSANNLVLTVEGYSQKTILGISELKWTGMSLVRYAEYKKEKWSARWRIRSEDKNWKTYILHINTSV